MCSNITCDCWFELFAVVAFLCIVVLNCYKLFYSRFSIISSNSSIWDIFRLDLPEILAEETRDKIKGWPKWWIFLLFFLPWIFEVFSHFPSCYELFFLINLCSHNDISLSVMQTSNWSNCNNIWADALW